MAVEGSVPLPGVIVPHLVVRDAAEAVDFYIRAFAATILYRSPSPSGVGEHIHLKIWSSLVQVSTEEPAQRADRIEGALLASPETLTGSTCVFQIGVDDVDEAYRHAVDHGASPAWPPTDMFWGDRYGWVRDPFGHVWAFAQVKEVLTPQQIEQRLVSFTTQQKSEPALNLSSPFAACPSAPLFVVPSFVCHSRRESAYRIFHRQHPQGEQPMLRLATSITLALSLALPLIAAAQTAPASPAPDPFKALAFLEQDWEANTNGSAGVQSTGTYTFRRELGGHILARRATSDAACKGPASFDCEHHDILYVFEEAPAQPLKAIYFDNEGHVIHYDVSTPTPTSVVFLSEAGHPGPQFRLSYELKDSLLLGKFQMHMPGQTEWKSYLEWSGPKK